MNVVERAARAIHDALENDDDSDGGGYMRAARAVLQAIREPSEAMSVAVDKLLEQNQGVYVSDAEIWQAMLDAALSE